MTDRELDRRAAHRLAVIRHAQEVTGNVSQTCRYYGITRQANYEWLRRYKSGGVAELRDGSSRAHSSPNAPQAEVVGKIVYLRQTYHFRPHKIAMYLERCHELRLSPSGIWRILHHLDMSRLPASQRYRRHKDRWKRYEKPQPGSRVQIAVKFIAPLPGSRRKHYQYTAIDDCTRIRVLRAYDRCNQATSIRFLDEVLARPSFRVETIQTDSGAEFQSSFHLPRPRPRHRPRLHPAGDTPAQWQGRAVAPDRCRRVLQAPRRGRDRRVGPVRRAPAGVGGLLQIRSTARRPRRPDVL